MRARRLVLLLLAGAALAALRAALPEPPRPLEVVVAADATEGERDRALVEAVLLEEAIGLGWGRTDPVVAGLIVHGLRAAGVDGTDADLLDEGLALGMARTDPLVRRRLIDRAERSLARVPEPDDARLAAHLAAHPDRFRGADQLRLEHVFARGDDAPAERPAVGEPLLNARSGQLTTARGVREAWGDDVADLLGDADGRWAGPARSPYGWHWVRIVETRPAKVPPLDLVRAAVRADLLRDADADDARLASLLARWRPVGVAR